MGCLNGGLGTKVIEAINDSDLKDIKIKTFGYNDCFVKHGLAQELEKEYKLNKEDILHYIKNMI